VDQVVKGLRVEIPEDVDDQRAACPRWAGIALPVEKKCEIRRGVEITEDVDDQRAARPRRAGTALPVRNKMRDET
jgi:hypothetical protein